MRQFQRMIFDGNGVHSAFEQQGLIDRVEAAFEIMSGLQQGEIDDEDNVGWIKELKDILFDVAAALGFEIAIQVDGPEFNGPGLNMISKSSNDRYFIRVFEFRKNKGQKWHKVEMEEFADHIGLSYDKQEEMYLNEQDANDALNFLTHGRTAFLGHPDAPCQKFGKNRFYAIFPM